VNKNYYFFWRGKFSQWIKSPFEEFGVQFGCAEQFMMASKAKLFGDNEAYEQIMNTKSPKAQQAFGTKVKGFDKEIWDDNARDIVTLGNLNKFTQNEDLFKLLYKNKDKFFVEASPYDKVWGVGLSETDPLIQNSKNWTGKNWLGECLNRTVKLIVEKKYKEVFLLKQHFMMKFK